MTAETRKAVLTAPPKIFLQISDDSEHFDAEFPGDEVTWCADSIATCEVPYTRADLAPTVRHEDTLRLDWLLQQVDEAHFSTLTFPNGRIGSTLEQKRQAIDDTMFFDGKAVTK
ncbi:hypothetical protein [Nevskia ramosa]|uniref:hypothetical protein n=1 Tax=Nevskia ramosa TaxID=64002 RepID=UPI003D0BBB7D